MLFAVLAQGRRDAILWVKESRGRRPNMRRGANNQLAETFSKPSSANGSKVRNGPDHPAPLFRAV
ncbi:hypothetical protein PT2222_440011 [Paraburkholderia tropica]